MRTRETIEFVVGALFAVALMLAALLASEAANPFESPETTSTTSRPPPGEQAHLSATRVKGTRPVVDPGLPRR